MLLRTNLPRGLVLSRGMIVVATVASLSACTCGPDGLDGAVATDMGPIIFDSAALPDSSPGLDAGPGSTALCGDPCSGLGGCMVGEIRPSPSNPNVDCVCVTAFTWAMTTCNLAVPCSFGESRCSTETPGAICRCASGGMSWTVVGQCNAGNTCVENGPLAECSPGDCVIGSTICDGTQVRFCLAGVYECPVECTPGESCSPATGGCSM